MTDRIKKVLMGVAALAALALGGSAIAGAVSTNDTAATQQTQQSGTAADQAGNNGRHSGETPLTGDTAAKVEQAALAETGGGTVERVETDADGNAAYEAHVVKSDGTRVTVYVDKQFNVVGVDEANGAGQPNEGAQKQQRIGRAPHPRREPGAITGLPRFMQEGEAAMTQHRRRS